MRKSNKTTKKYIEFLKDMQFELKQNKHKHIMHFPRKHLVSNVWVVFLKKKNIIYKNNYGFFEWNNKIPVTAKLILEFRKFNKSYNEKYNNLNKSQVQIKFNDNDKKESSNEIQYNSVDWLRINQVKEIYGKSESTIRSISRGLRKNKSKHIRLSTNENGREIILLDKNYLDSILKKAPIEMQSKIIVNNDKQELGLIRKFLKWIY